MTDNHFSDRDRKHEITVRLNDEELACLDALVRSYWRKSHRPGFTPHRYTREDVVQSLIRVGGRNA